MSAGPLQALRIAVTLACSALAALPQTVANHTAANPSLGVSIDTAGNLVLFIDLPSEPKNPQRLATAAQSSVPCASEETTSVTEGEWSLELFCPGATQDDNLLRRVDLPWAGLIHAIQAESDGPIDFWIQHPKAHYSSTDEIFGEASDGDDSTLVYRFQSDPADAPDRLHLSFGARDSDLRPSTAGLIAALCLPMLFVGLIGGGALITRAALFQSAWRAVQRLSPAIGFASVVLWFVYSERSISVRS